MSGAFSLVVPVILCLMAIYALHKRCDVYSALYDGAYDGLKIVVKILPSLIALLSAIYMMRASGLLTAITSLLEPIMSKIGIPAEVTPLMLLRPFSGSGALAVAGEVMEASGPDSLVGRTAAIMLGSTETTFYVIAVYFGAAKISKTRHAIPAAVIADLTGFFVAALTARLFF